jgi:hypothetical protein
MTDEGTGRLLAGCDSGVYFLWLLSFVQAKESDSPARAKNKVKVYHEQSSKHAHVWMNYSKDKSESNLMTHHC